MARVALVRCKTAKWKDVLSAAHLRSKALTSRVELFPVPLIELARLQKVKNVVFPEELLPEGCLEPIYNGFIIHVKRLNNYEADDLNERLNGEATGGELLPDRIRFTIAHEIAHTFFYDLRHETPAKFIKSNRVEHVKKVERACDELASKLLLPWTQMEKLASASDFWNPGVLSAFAKRAGVSTPALILRLRPLLGNKGLVIFDADDNRNCVKYNSIGKGLLMQLSWNGKELFIPQIIDEVLSENVIYGASNSTIRLKCTLPEFTKRGLPTVWDCHLMRMYGARWLMSFSLVD
jgi:uncharacterized protein DUF955